MSAASDAPRGLWPMTAPRTLRVVIVGGSSGMGLATAKRFAKRGDDVTIVSRSQEKLDAALTAIGDADGKLRSVPLDMTDEARLGAFASQLEPRSVDALVVSASSVVHGALADTPLDDVRRMFEAKFMGPYAVSKALLPALAQGAALVLFSGVLSRRPGSAASALAAINAAVEGLTRALAKELGPAVRVNCISPGMTRTEAYDGMPAERREAMFENAAGNVPLARVGEPDDIARAVEFAVLNPFLTGQVIDVDGGHTIA